MIIVMYDAEVKLKLIMGLGNAGARYAHTYHNAGHLFADFAGERFKMHSATCNVLKNDGFMNEAGAFVKKALKKRGAKPEELLIAHDDSDIALGEYTYSFGRGSAGHKGVASVIAAIGTKNFLRLRIGIRPRALIRRKAELFVLKPISAAHQKTLEDVFVRAAKKLATHC